MLEEWTLSGTQLVVVGSPTEEEAAAIVAAVAASLPSGGFAPVEESSAVRWKFSGRWWSKPVALRRDRPWQFR